jgi:hypothetical protein
MNRFSSLSLAAAVLALSCTAMPAHAQLMGRGGLGAASAVVWAAWVVALAAASAAR